MVQFYIRINEPNHRNFLLTCNLLVAYTWGVIKPAQESRADTAVDRVFKALATPVDGGYSTACA